MLEEDLCKVDSSDPAIISEIIDKYSEQPHLKEKSAYFRLVSSLLSFYQSTGSTFSLSVAKKKICIFGQRTRDVYKHNATLVN